MENVAIALLAVLFVLSPLLLLYGEYRYGLFRPELRDEPAEPAQTRGSIFAPDDTAYSLFFRDVLGKRTVDWPNEIETRARELAANIAANSAMPHDDLIKLARFKREALTAYLEALRKVASEMNSQRALGWRQR